MIAQKMRNLVKFGGENVVHNWRISIGDTTQKPSGVPTWVL
jgi:hypothetical protein